MNDIENLLLKANAPEDFPGKEAIWQRLEAEQSVKRRRPARKVVRVALLAAVIMVLATTTVFAEEIRQLFFGNSQVTPHEELVSAYDGESIIASITYHNRESLVELPANAGDSTYEKFATVEEAQAAAPFRLKVPTWAPEGYEYENTGVLRTPGDIYMETAGVSYVNPGLSTPESIYGYSVYQEWVGRDAWIEMDHVGGYEDFTTLTVNGCEAIHAPAGGLYWIEDGVLYNIYGVLTLEERVQIAESLQ